MPTTRHRKSSLHLGANCSFGTEPLLSYLRHFELSLQLLSACTITRMGATTFAEVSVTFLNHLFSSIILKYIISYHIIIYHIILYLGILTLACFVSPEMRQAEEIRLMGKRPPGSKRPARALLLQLAEKLGRKVSIRVSGSGSVGV